MMNDDLCNIITACSKYISDWQIKQPNVKEETLTDWLLYQISELLPFVKYYAYSRHEEARTTGADWEWWLLRENNRHLTFRVQAKKVSRSKDNYAGLAYTNKYGLQIEKLLDDANIVNAIPLYAFFDFEGSKESCLRSDVSRDGVFLAGANLIYDNYITGGKARINSEDLLSKTQPFSCFGCCPLVDDFEKFLHHYYPDEFLDRQSEYEKSDLNIGINEHLPFYVDALLENKPSDIGLGFESKKHNFDRLLIYDLR